jgi:hypothetical protein
VRLADVQSQSQYVGKVGQEQTLERRSITFDLRNVLGARQTNVRSWGKSGRHLLVLSVSQFDPTETLSLIASGPVINLKIAKALGIDIPATLLGSAAARSLDGLRAEPHDTVSASTGR